MISTKMKSAFVGMAAVAALSIGVTQAISADETTKPASSQSSCLSNTQLTTRMVVNGNTLFIEDMSGRGAVLEMAAPCNHMRDLDQIGFIFNGSSQICGRSDIIVTHSSSNGTVPARCVVKSYTPLTREEAKAYVADLTKK